jgi:hypothetical protein
MLILGIIASSITGNLVTNSYESIATVTVGSGGAAMLNLVLYLLITLIYKLEVLLEQIEQLTAQIQLD